MYKFMLDNLLWSTMQNCSQDPRRLVFQHGNDPKHTSKIVQERLASQPFQTPSMNGMHNL